MPRRRGQVALPPLRSLWLVAVGGAVGGLGRASVGYVFPVEEGAFPWSTWAENLVGAYLLGLLLTLLLERAIDRTWAKPLLATGMLGAFTTFATLSFELVRLSAGGHLVLLAAYLAATAGGGLLAATLGVGTARKAVARRRIAR